jgi:hypothetical protein
MLTEFHITVKANSILEWGRACSTIGVKPLIIRLDKGKHLEQMMCSTVVPMPLEMTNSYADCLSTSIEKLGFEVLRKKAEVQWGERLHGIYHEAHYEIKPKAFEAVRWFVEHYKLALSYSTLNGKQWITYRKVESKKLDHTDIYFQMEDIARHLRDDSRCGYVSHHKETVLFDTFQELDAGWLE